MDGFACTTWNFMTMSNIIYFALDEYISKLRGKYVQ